MNIVNKLLNFLLILIILTNCSLNNRSKFWSKSEIVKKEKLQIKEVYKEPEIYDKEFNVDLKFLDYFCRLQPYFK